MLARSVGVFFCTLLIAVSARAGDQLSYKEFLARNLSSSAKLSLGMTKAEVTGAMGDFETETNDGPIYNPWSAEAFTRGEDTFEVLFYLVRRHPPFTPILRNQAVSVVFKNGNLVAWGRNADAAFR